MVNDESETPRARARRGIRAAQRAVAAASKLRGHTGVRKQIAEVGALARKIRRRVAWAAEFDRFARHRGVPEIPLNGSPTLEVNIVEWRIRRRFPDLAVRPRVVFSPILTRVQEKIRSFVLNTRDAN
jgi:hypothetical protein